MAGLTLGCEMRDITAIEQLGGLSPLGRLEKLRFLGAIG